MIICERGGEAVKFKKKKVDTLANLLSLFSYQKQLIWQQFLKQRHIPDICQLRDTTALFSPEKVHQTVHKFATK